MNRREANLAQAALVPLFGGMDKKPRPLERDVVSIGRARGCDIILEAPDVSTLHCLIYRTPEGYRIRDCGSRTGTRVNGGPVRNQVLTDEDVLHVGPFSFQVYLPGRQGQPGPKRPERDHLERSRRNLGHLALRLRGRYRDLLSGPGTEQRADLRRREAELKARIRAYDSRATQLEQAERELEQERAELVKEKETNRHHAQRLQDDLLDRRGEVEQQVQQRWQEFQARCVTEEQRLDQWSRQLQEEADRLKAGLGQPEAPVSAERNEELDALALKLAAQEEELARAREHLGRGRDEIKREREEVQQMREQWAGEQAEAGAFFERQRLALAEAEAALKEQRQELARMMGDLRELQQGIRQQQQVDVPALLRENEQLRQLVAEWHEKAASLEELASRPQQDPDLIEQVQAQANALDKLRDHIASQDAQIAKLRQDNEQLRKLVGDKDKMLQERDKQVSELQRRLERSGSAASEAVDLETYEAELNRYRQQLDSDRARLTGEMDALRQRNAELDEATREMEMEMSRERAELARERMRLDRLRDEVRSEMERMQREAGVRESLASVHKLREEMNGKKAVPGADRGLNDRLKNLRNQLQE